MMHGTFKLDFQQVLMGGQDGYVYIMIDFEVYECFVYIQRKVKNWYSSSTKTKKIYQWFKVGFSITSVIQFRPNSLEDDETDMVICTGHSNEVLIYQNGNVRIL